MTGPNGSSDMRLTTPTRPLRQTELVMLLAALMSLMAFSIDSIMPALPEIAGDFIPDAPSRAQLAISSFVIGTGIGQIFLGPFSDSFGRRPTLLLGIGLFIAGAHSARVSTGLEPFLVARFVQGLGAASSRIVSQAVMRDLYSGREQARIGSIVFTFFVVIPALAPLIGQGIVALTGGWRGLFAAYSGLGTLVLAWFLLRQPETLAPDRRRPFGLGPVIAAAWEVLRTPVALRYLIVASLAFGQLMSYINSAQQVFADTLGAGTRFPVYFAAIALLSGVSGFINARVVMRLGMRPLARLAFASQAVIAGAFWLAWHFGLIDRLPAATTLALFVAWSVTLFFMNGMTFGNITALAMEPLGHVAGTASAVLGALSSVLAMVIAVPVGLAFDGTPRALLLGVALCSAAAFWLIHRDRDRVRD